MPHATTSTVTETPAAPNDRAGLGRPVEQMIGGIDGWKNEGFALEMGSA